MISLNYSGDRESQFHSQEAIESVKNEPLYDLMNGFNPFPSKIYPYLYKKTAPYGPRLIGSALWSMDT